jgi:hypothetical protein
MGYRKLYPRCLNVQCRHQAQSTRPEWDLRSCTGKGVKCPVLIIGIVNGSRVRLSHSQVSAP